jgi:hypothetical protein
LSTGLATFPRAGCCSPRASAADDFGSPIARCSAQPQHTHATGSACACKASPTQQPACRGSVAPARGSAPAARHCTVQQRMQPPCCGGGRTSLELGV